MKLNLKDKIYDSVLSLSGGLDTTVLAYTLVAKGLKPLCVYVDYGANFRKTEKKFAKRTCRKLGLDFLCVNFRVYKQLAKCQMFGDNVGEAGSVHWLEGRNCIISLILAVIASSVKASEVYLGSHKPLEGGWEAETYPDATPECYVALNDTIKAGFKREVKIRTPFIEQDLDKAGIVALGEKLKVKWRNTISCCTSDIPCGKCEACQDREKAFKIAKVMDK